MSADQKFTRELGDGETPRPAKGVEVEYRAAAALPASGAWATGAAAIDLEGARRLTVLVDYDAAAIGNYPHLIVLGSALEVAPGLTDDSWYDLPIHDGSVNPVTRAGTWTGPAQMTNDPPWGEVLLRGSLYRFPAAVAAPDKWRRGIPFDVTEYRWAAIHIAEKGVTATPGTARLAYVLST